MFENNLSLVSIIVPIYKVKDYLDECVQSIVDQTYRNLEIILVDDGSPDACPQMCDDWAKKDNRIKVVHKPNGGLSSARNAGLDVAKGEYLCFVDSDDFITQDYVEVMYKRIVNDDTVGIVSGMIYRFTDGRTTTFNKTWIHNQEKKTDPTDFVVSCINQSVSYTAWNKMFRSDLLKKVRFREGRTNEDTLFMYDLGKAIKFTNYSMIEIPTYVYYYRCRPDSICTSTKRPLTLDILLNLHDMMDDCVNSDRRLWKVLYYQYCKTLYHFLDNLLLNEVWKPLYFKKYQFEFRQIPYIYIWKNFKIKDILYIHLLKWLPFIRRRIRIISEYRKKK